MGLKLGLTTMQLDSNSINQSTIKKSTLEKIKRYLVAGTPLGAIPPLSTEDVDAMVKFARQRTVKFEFSDAKKVVCQMMELIQSCMEKLRNE